MFARKVEVAAAELKFAQRGGIKWIIGETIAIFDCLYLGNSAFRALVLGDRDGAVERDHGRRMNLHQCIVQCDDHLPIGILYPESGGMRGSDCRFDVILDDQLAGRGKLQQSEPFKHELSIPQRPILVKEHNQITSPVDTCRQTRGIQVHKGRESLGRGRSARRVLQQNCDEPDRLMAEFGTHRLFRRCAMIALTKKKIERTVDRWKPR